MNKVVRKKSTSFQMLAKELGVRARMRLAPGSTIVVKLGSNAIS